MGQGATATTSFQVYTSVVAIKSAKASENLKSKPQGPHLVMELYHSNRNRNQDMYVCLYMCAYMCVGTHRGQKVSDPLELELLVIM